MPRALGAIVVGSVIGVALLAATGVVGSQTGLPTMVCLRRALGRRGSYVATGFNVVQLVGWTVFELVIMGHAANAVVRGVTGLDAAWLWIVLFGGAVTLVASLAGWLFALAVGPGIESPPSREFLGEPAAERDGASLPSTWRAYAPILIPLALIAGRSTAPGHRCAVAGDRRRTFQ